MKWNHRLLGLFVGALMAAALVLPQSAAAEYGIPSFAAEIENQAGDPETQAGIHPFKVTNSFTVAPDPDDAPKPGGAVKDVIVDLPPGLVGDPTKIPTCSQAQLVAQECPLSSQVGRVAIQFVVAPLPPPFPATVITRSDPLFNMDAPQGMAAQFASLLLGVKVYLNASVRPGDNGIRISSLNTSATLALTEVDVEFWGVPASSSFDTQRGYNPGPARPAGTNPVPLLTTPTDCTQNPPVTRLRTNSWQNPDQWVIKTFEHPVFEGCADLDYRGELSLTPESRAAGAPSGYTVELTQQLTSSAASLATADLRRAEVVLPSGVGINPAAGTGLSGCSAAEIGLGSDAAPTCPASSRIGSVTIDTPLLKEQLRGAVYQATPYDNPFDSLLALYLVPEEPTRGVRLKLAGEVALDPATGQIRTTFDDNPRLPFTNLRLELNGGERAILTNPKSCGDHDGEANLSPWSGNAPSIVPFEFRIDQACGRAGKFDPQLSAGTANPVAGQVSPFSLVVKNPVGGQDLLALSAHLPEGLLAMVSQVPLCDAAAADAGACAEASRVGRVEVGVGSGSTSLWVPEAGKSPTGVFLAGPYRGAPYSLSVVVPAEAGPFDLGTVVSRAPLHVDPRTTEITTGIAESRIFAADGSLKHVVDGAMPDRLEGIPLEIRELRVLIDRPGFTFNPTNCTPSVVAATLGSSAGQGADRAARFQVGDCASLAFSPRIGMRVLNKGRKSTLRSFNPAMRFVVSPQAGQANISRARVTLPPSVILDQGHIRTVCTRAQFAERNCPEGSIYGYAKAWSPVLNRPVRGPVYLGSSNNQLPDLIADMDGEVRIVLQGRIDTARGGRIRTTFGQVPDAPVSRFVLQMRGGDRGILVNSTDLCRANLRAASVLAGHSGRRQATRPAVRLGYRGCKQIRRKAARKQVQRKLARRAAVRSGQVNG